MFESDCSEDEFDARLTISDNFQKKEEIPLKLWAEHFRKPDKERSSSLNCIFQREFILMKGMYCFLEDSQIFGKTLTKFGIPNVCGKISKNFLQHKRSNNTSKKFEKVNKIYLSKNLGPTKKTFKRTTAKRVYKDIQAPRYTPVAERWSDVALRKFKHTRDSPVPTVNNYVFVNDDNQLKGDSKKNNGYLKADNNITNSQIQKICEPVNIDSSETVLSQPNNVTTELIDSTSSKVFSRSDDSENNHEKENSESWSTAVVVSEPNSSLQKLGLKGNLKKCVRFNDNDLCAFAPTQSFSDDSVKTTTQNESEKLFDEMMNHSDDNIVIGTDNVQNTSETVTEITKTTGGVKNINFTSKSTIKINPFTSKEISSCNENNIIDHTESHTINEKEDNNKCLVDKINTEPHFEIEPYDRNDVVIEESSYSSLSDLCQINKNEEKDIRNSGPSSHVLVEKDSLLNEIQIEQTVSDKGTCPIAINDVQLGDNHDSKINDSQSSLTPVEKGSIIVEETPSVTDETSEKCLDSTARVLNEHTDSISQKIITQNQLNENLTDMKSRVVSSQNNLISKDFISNNSDGDYITIIQDQIPLRNGDLEDIKSTVVSSRDNLISKDFISNNSDDDYISISQDQIQIKNGDLEDIKSTVVSSRDNLISKDFISNNSDHDYITIIQDQIPLRNGDLEDIKSKVVSSRDNLISKNFVSDYSDEEYFPISDSDQSQEGIDFKTKANTQTFKPGSIKYKTNNFAISSLKENDYLSPCERVHENYQSNIMTDPSSRQISKDRFDNLTPSNSFSDRDYISNSSDYESEEEQINASNAIPSTNTKQTINVVCSRMDMESLTVLQDGTNSIPITKTGLIDLDQNQEANYETTFEKRGELDVAMNKSKNEYKNLSIDVDQINTFNTSSPCYEPNSSDGYPPTDIKALGISGSEVSTPVTYTSRSKVKLLNEQKKRSEIINAPSKNNKSTNSSHNDSELIIENQTFDGVKKISTDLNIRKTLFPIQSQSSVLNSDLEPEIQAKKRCSLYESTESFKTISNVHKENGLNCLFEDNNTLCENQSYENKLVNQPLSGCEMVSTNLNIPDLDLQIGRAEPTTQDLHLKNSVSEPEFDILTPEQLLDRTTVDIEANGSKTKSLRSQTVSNADDKNNTNKFGVVPEVEQSCNEFGHLISQNTLVITNVFKSTPSTSNIDSFHRNIIDNNSSDSACISLSAEQSGENVFNGTEQTVEEHKNKHFYHSPTLKEYTSDRFTSKSEEMSTMTSSKCSSSGTSNTYKTVATVFNIDDTKRSTENINSSFTSDIQQTSNTKLRNKNTFYCLGGNDVDEKSSNSKMLSTTAIQIMNNRKNQTELKNRGSTVEKRSNFGQNPISNDPLVLEIKETSFNGHDKNDTSNKTFETQKRIHRETSKSQLYHTRDSLRNSSPMLIDINSQYEQVSEQTKNLSINSEGKTIVNKDNQYNKNNKKDNKEQDSQLKLVSEETSIEDNKEKSDFSEFEQHSSLPFKMRTQQNTGKLMSTNPLNVKLHIDNLTNHTTNSKLKFAKSNALRVNKQRKNESNKSKFLKSPFKMRTQQNTGKVMSTTPLNVKLHNYNSTNHTTNSKVKFAKSNNLKVNKHTHERYASLFGSRTLSSLSSIKMNSSQQKRQNEGVGMNVLNNYPNDNLNYASTSSIQLLIQKPPKEMLTNEQQEQSNKQRMQGTTHPSVNFKINKSTQQKENLKNIINTNSVVSCLQEVVRDHRSTSFYEEDSIVNSESDLSPKSDLSCLNFYENNFNSKDGEEHISGRSEKRKSTSESDQDQESSDSEYQERSKKRSIQTLSSNELNYTVSLNEQLQRGSDNSNVDGLLNYQNCQNENARRILNQSITSYGCSRADNTGSEHTSTLKTDSAFPSLSDDDYNMFSTGSEKENNDYNNQRYCIDMFEDVEDDQLTRSWSSNQSINSDSY